MVSQMMITIGALIVAGSFIAMFFTPISGTLITTAIIGSIIMAGGMFAKSTRSGDDIPGMKNDGLL